ncbi:MAG: hypothetical protein Marn2KO_30710 [Marinobacter nauticus]
MERPQTKLLQKHNLVARRVVWKHAGGITPDKQFPGKDGHVATIEARMRQPEFVHSEEALEHGFTFFDFDVAGVELEWFWHYFTRLRIRP